MVIGFFVLASWTFQSQVVFGKIHHQGVHKKIITKISSPVSGTPGLTLKEAYLAALKTSEKLGVQDELLIQANELEKQAFATLLPSVMANAEFKRQTEHSSEQGTQFYPPTSNTIAVSAVQHLFQGFREFATIRQKKAQVQVQKYALQDAARLLFYDTTTAYYNVLALESDERTLQEEILANKKRLLELNHFLHIGRSRLPDVLTQKTNISSLEAQVESIRGQLGSARAILAFLTGLDQNVKLQDDENLPDGDLEKLSVYIAQIENRADVKVARENVVAFEENIPIATAQHLPSADLVGNYYVIRPGLSSAINWEVALQISMPIFQGGTVESQVRQAAAQRKQYEYLLDEARRIAQQEITQFYESFGADQKQIQKLTETAEISGQNYGAELKDYRNGLVSNLEVFQTLSSWQAARRGNFHQQLIAKADFTKLQVASGQRNDAPSLEDRFTHAQLSQEKK